MRASDAQLGQRIDGLASAQRQSEASLKQDIRAINDNMAKASDLEATRDALSRQIVALEGKKADRADVAALDEKKLDLAAVDKLGLDEIRRRLVVVEYENRSNREELLTAVSTGYRNAVRSARETVVEIEPILRNIIAGQQEQSSIFIRDFRGIDDKVTVLGDLLSREFTSFSKARAGLDKSLYREEFVIRLYRQKGLKVPGAEAFNLDNLEKGGFPSKRVIVISGRITPTSKAFRLDVEATDLKDPQFRASASRLIPRDSDIDQTNTQVIGEQLL